jgi:hypothetical protein
VAPPQAPLPARARLCASAPSSSGYVSVLETAPRRRCGKLQLGSSSCAAAAERQQAGLWGELPAQRRPAVMAAGGPRCVFSRVMVLLILLLPI